MIGDCVQLAVEARVIRASIEESGKGIVLAKYRNQWVVWRIFRAKRALLWNCRDGTYFSDRARAEEFYAGEVDETMPPISCDECGYYFDDPDEGCDACASRKKVPPTSMAVGT